MGRLLPPMGVHPLLGAWDLPWFGPVADQKGLQSWGIYNKTVQGSLRIHALQRKDSGSAIESFWRWTFVKIWLVWWSMGVPKGPQGVLGAPWGVTRGPRGVI